MAHLPHELRSRKAGAGQVLLVMRAGRIETTLPVSLYLLNNT
jgi:hypothetical protein